MQKNIIGSSVSQRDALDKVTGRARYTADLCPKDALVARILPSIISNGRVRAVDLSRAQALPGVELALSCFDVPDRPFPGVGALYPQEQTAIRDRHLLESRVRYQGDPIAVVVARDECTAAQALEKIRVRYEEYPASLDIQSGLQAPGLHQNLFSGNLLARENLHNGSMGKAVSRPGLHYVEKNYRCCSRLNPPTEAPSSYAYMEGGQLVVVSSCRSLHALRHILSLALGIPSGKIRVCQPCVGAGSGERLEALYEPLNAYLSLRLNGRCVRLSLSREEALACSPREQAMDFQAKAWADEKGILQARDMKLWANQGAYACNGQGIVGRAIKNFAQTYQDAGALNLQSASVYTNTAPTGAGPASGYLQAAFAQESLMEDLSRSLGLDPIEFRRQNLGDLGQDQRKRLEECLNRGSAAIGWQERRRRYERQLGSQRRGLGMALFSLGDGKTAAPSELATARMMLEADGSVQLQIGASGLEQGADTSLLQIASAACSIPMEKIHVPPLLDTAWAPFDSGGEPGHLSQVRGQAVKKAALLLRKRIIDYAALLLNCPADLVFFDGRQLLDSRNRGQGLRLEELAQRSYYDKEHPLPISAEASHSKRESIPLCGCAFAEVEVDISLGQVKLLRLVNVLDSGTLINPALSAAQARTDQYRGLCYALSPGLAEGANLPPGPLREYLLPAGAEDAQMQCIFVQQPEPKGVFGNKPIEGMAQIPIAAAIRNAILQATGVAIDEIPLSSSTLLRRFREEGLLPSFPLKEEAHV